MLTKSKESLSTGNAPQLEHLINFETDEIRHDKYVDEWYYPKMDYVDNGISQPDVIKLSQLSCLKWKKPETMQTINSDQPLEEQDASQFMLLSILTADTIEALHSQKLLKVLLTLAPLIPSSIEGLYHGNASRSK
jgi:hypothetical protein